MKKLLLLSILGLFMSTLSAQVNEMTITILYDNYVYNKHLKADWGFSCLIECSGKTILFDTGTKPDILRHNIGELEIDVAEIDIIVISHNHRDHTGGLFFVLEKNPDVDVYLISSFPGEFRKLVEDAGARLHVLDESTEIIPDVFTTGKMGTSIKEQSLIINTAKGLVIITGCSHQGILNILEKSSELLNGNIYLVFGGFHLIDHTESHIEEIIRKFKEFNVAYCGPTHCTGDKAIDMFRKTFGKNFVEMGVGKIIDLDNNKL